jgi:hypothetical protein
MRLAESDSDRVGIFMSSDSLLALRLLVDASSILEDLCKVLEFRKRIVSSSRLRDLVCTGISRKGPLGLELSFSQLTKSSKSLYLGLVMHLNNAVFKSSASEDIYESDDRSDVFSWRSFIIDAMSDRSLTCFL